MGLVSFLFFHYKLLLILILATRSQTSYSCFPLFDVDHLEIGNCSNLTTVFHTLGNFEPALCIRLCHEDLILTRKSHNCVGIAFIQGTSMGFPYGTLIVSILYAEYLFYIILIFILYLKYLFCISNVCSIF